MLNIVALKSETKFLENSLKIQVDISLKLTFVENFDTFKFIEERTGNFLYLLRMKTFFLSLFAKVVFEIFIEIYGLVSFSFVALETERN